MPTVHGLEEDITSIKQDKRKKISNPNKEEICSCFIIGTRETGNLRGLLGIIAVNYSP